MKVRYTNMASSVEAWLVKAEEILDASGRKIVGLDVEYDKTRESYNNKKKPTVIQLCYGNDVLVYHIYHADEKCPKLHDFLWGWRYIFAGFCIAEDKNVLGRAGLPVHNLKDIHQVWRDPEKSWKRTQGLKDVAGAIIDPYYENMQDGFGKKEHNMWANAPPLSEKHLEYAARDAYATYEGKKPVSKKNLDAGKGKEHEASAKVNKEKTPLLDDSEATDSDDVQDGKQDLQDGKDDFHDAKEDL
ncbi:hypothetical protein ACQ4PT_013104 [Festuca glaucescens]